MVRRNGLICVREKPTKLTVTEEVAWRLFPSIFISAVDAATLFDSAFLSEESFSAELKTAHLDTRTVQTRQIAQTFFAVFEILSFTFKHILRHSSFFPFGVSIGLSRGSLA